MDRASLIPFLAVLSLPLSFRVGVVFFVPPTVVPWEDWPMIRCTRGLFVIVAVNAVIAVVVVVEVVIVEVGQDGIVGSYIIGLHVRAWIFSLRTRIGLHDTTFFRHHRPVGVPRNQNRQRFVCPVTSAIKCCWVVTQQQPRLLPRTHA